MAYAVFKTGGKQYRVQQGDRIVVDRLNLEKDTEAVFNEVLLVQDESGVKVGTPTVANSVVKAKVIEQVRGKKGVAFKFKRRKGFHKKKGFRAALTLLEISSIA